MHSKCLLMYYAKRTTTTTRILRLLMTVTRFMLPKSRHMTTKPWHFRPTDTASPWSCNINILFVSTLHIREWFKHEIHSLPKLSLTITAVYRTCIPVIFYLWPWLVACCISVMVSWFIPTKFQLHFLNDFVFLPYSSYFLNDFVFLPHSSYIFAVIILGTVFQFIFS